MRKPKFTDEEIIGAGKSLHSQGKDVSPNSIKRQLGGGNPARIKKVWDQYKANFDEASFRKSPLKEPLDFDDKFAFSVDRHVQNAADQTEGIFIKLLEKIKDDTAKRFDELLERQEREHSFAMGELMAQLGEAQANAKHWKKSRNGKRSFQDVLPPG